MRRIRSVVGRIAQRPRPDLSSRFEIQPVQFVRSNNQNRMPEKKDCADESGNLSSATRSPLAIV
jgi:hypothetical protein